MIKKLPIVLLLFPLLSLSQIPTVDMNGNITYYKQDTIKLPITVARRVVKDLVDYESVKLQLHLCKEELDLTNKKCQAKDTIITNYKYKVENCESRILIEKDKIELYKEETSRLKKQYRLLKLKNTVTQIGSGLLVATVAYLLIAK